MKGELQNSEEGKLEAQRLLEQIDGCQVSLENHVFVVLDCDLVDPKYGMADVDEHHVPRGYSIHDQKKRIRRRRKYDREVTSYLESIREKNVTLENIINHLSQINSNNIIKISDADMKNLAKIMGDTFLRCGFNEYWVEDMYFSRIGISVALCLPHYSGWPYVYEDKGWGEETASDTS